MPSLFKCVRCLLSTKTPYTVAFAHPYGVGPEMGKLEAGNTQQHFCTPLCEAFFNTSVCIRKCERLCDRWYLYERFYVSKLGINSWDELDLLALKQLRAESANPKKISESDRECLVSHINKLRTTRLQDTRSRGNQSHLGI